MKQNFVLLHNNLFWEALDRYPALTSTWPPDVLVDVFVVIFIHYERILELYRQIGHDRLLLNPYLLTIHHHLLTGSCINFCRWKVSLHKLIINKHNLRNIYIRSKKWYFMNYSAQILRKWRHGQNWKLVWWFFSLPVIWVWCNCVVACDSRLPVLPCGRVPEVCSCTWKCACGGRGSADRGAPAKKS